MHAAELGNTALRVLNRGQAAHDQGVVRGHADGNFRPNNSITRGQTATLFAQYDQYVLGAVDERILPIQHALTSHGEEIGALQDQVGRAWSGPVYTLTPDFEAEGCRMVVSDHNGVGSGTASVEYSVDGRQPVAIVNEGDAAQPIPAEGFLAFDVDAEGMVSVLVDSVVWAHAHTAEGCEPT